MTTQRWSDGLQRLTLSRWRLRQACSGLTALLVALGGVSAASAANAGAPTNAAEGSALGSQEQALEAFADLPLSFVENQGQVDPRVRYHTQGSDYAFFFAPGEVMLSFSDTHGPATGAAGAQAVRTRGVNLALRFVGAKGSAVPRAGGPTAQQVNYLRGDDAAGWRTGLTGYGSVTYPEVWPGIDMVLRGEDGTLKYEFRVRPGAKPSDIELAYAGARRLVLDASGDLRVRTAIGTLRDSAPVSYQMVGGVKVPVDSAFALTAGKPRQYGFSVGRYRRNRTLVIDPGLDYSTFVGGASMDRAEGVTVDQNGNAIVVGTTQSTDFPATPGAVDNTFNGGVVDVFVAKLNADGSGLVYATYLGGVPTPTRRGDGDPNEFGRAVTVDGSGNAYLTGRTTSSDFPTTDGVFQPNLAVSLDVADDAFVAKLSPTGALTYSTYLGGALGSEDPGSIAVDANGNAYVAGGTTSSDFPTTAGAFDQDANGGEDVFVAKLSPTASALSYSTRLGGADNELVRGDIAVDANGNAYVAGSTRSTGFPTTAGSLQPVHSGGEFADLFEAFVTKLNPTGSGLVYSTFLGGNRVDHAEGMTIDTTGNAYVVGGTQSSAFPTTAGAFDRTFDNTSEGYAAKLSADGSTLTYSTFLGVAAASDVAVDGAGNAWLGGDAGPGATTTLDAFQAQNNGGNDAYVAQLNATGSGLNFATYLGGTQSEFATGIALDPAENVYVAGTTFSADFPTTPGAFDRVFSGDPSIFWGDAFVAKFAADATEQPPGTPALSSLVLSPTSVAGGTSSTGTVTLDAAAPAGGTAVSLASSNTAAATVPASVTVPEGSTSTTFTVSTSTVSADTSSTISASLNGVSRSAVLTITAPTASQTTTFGGRIDDNQTVTHTVSMGTGTVDLNLNWDDGRVDLDLRGRDPFGTVVFFDGGSARPKTGSFTATVSGDYRFEVINNTGRNTDYTLTVTHPAVGSTAPADTSAPTVSVTSPTAGATVSGTVSVAASASDDVGVTQVQFFVDGTSIGTDTTTPYAVSWDTTTVANGSHVLTARASDAAGNTGTSASVSVTVDNSTVTPTLSSLALSPTSVTGGNSSTGTVTLDAPAGAGGVSVALASSNTAAATVPASVAVPQGATSATFTVSTSSVTADTSSTITATLDGVSRTAVLTVTAPAADTVSITRAEYDADKDQLRVEATSSSAGATLTVYVTSTDERIGTLSGGKGDFTWPTNPQNITVRSSLGGSTTSDVQLK